MWPSQPTHTHKQGRKKERKTERREVWAIATQWEENQWFWDRKKSKKKRIEEISGERMLRCVCVCIKFPISTLWHYHRDRMATDTVCCWWLYTTAPTYPDLQHPEDLTSSWLIICIESAVWCWTFLGSFLAIWLKIALTFSPVLAEVSKNIQPLSCA